MCYRLFILFLLFLCAIETGTGHSKPQIKGHRYVIVPNENVLLVVASQPGCPVRFEDTKLLMSVDGRELAVSYKLHNVGKKPIRYAHPLIWTSFDTGGTLSGSGPSSGKATDELILPGQAFHQRYSDEIVPLTDDLREKLKLRGPMRAIVVLMVESITFGDGTMYRDDATLKPLQAYFQELSTRLERLESLEGQDKLK